MEWQVIITQKNIEVDGVFVEVYEVVTIAASGTKTQTVAESIEDAGQLIVKLLASHVLGQT